ncbi:MAG: folate-binding protein YgfZ [Hyphomicrobiaceae bacterium]|nr:folate-binding protein YgfZ [Hyphomicrobiaceae bacterium]
MPARGVIRVNGPDARKLLQGIATNDMNKLDGQAAVHSGILSPQGKILFDFFVVATHDGVLLETGKAAVAPLRQRLEMYRLRSKAEISDASADFTVTVSWSEPVQPGGGKIDHSEDTFAFADPRHPALGERHLASLTSNWHKDLAGTEAATLVDYDAMRIAVGVPEAGSDFELGDTFPHEALYDQTGSVSFTKGCYVGQEIVSRVQHRGTARKRVVPVVGTAPLPAGGADITAGDVTIGRLGSVAGSRGLALLRLDRVAEFQAKGVTPQIGEISLSVDIPDWVTFSLDQPGTSAAP